MGGHNKKKKQTSRVELQPAFSKEEGMADATTPNTKKANTDNNNNNDNDDN